VIIPNGVDLDRFFPDDDVRLAIRTKEGVREAVVAIFVGGDWDRKGLRAAIEAVGLVRRAGLDLRLWVVGVGDQTRFTHLAGRAGADRAVRFWGRRSDAEDLYRAADVFVLPSLYESFSLVSLEAAASMLPLVLTAFNGAPELLVGHNEGGRVVRGDPSALAAALLELGRDESLRRELGGAARRRAEQFGWGSSAQRVLGWYRSLLQEWPSPEGRLGWPGVTDLS
jgi:glycosyltransferase involved in cell wall biosynthesis